MEINLSIEYDSVLVGVDTAGAAVGHLDIDAMLSDGWRLIRDVAADTQKLVGYLTFGDAPVVAVQGMPAPVWLGV